MAKLKRYKTNRLFHRASFIGGIGSIINVAGNYYDFNYTGSGEEADIKAIENDWGMIGDDIRQSVKKITKKLPQLQD